MVNWMRLVARDAFDPRAKALAYLIGSTLVLLATRLAELAVLGVLLGGLLLMLRLGSAWLRVMWALLPTLLLFAVVAWLSSGGTAAIGAGLRLLLLVSAGMLFFGTTPPDELGDALVASGVSPQLAFLLEGTLRFVPTMGQIVRDVRDAQASRGMRLDGLYLLRNGPLLLAPLLISAVRFADDLSEGLTVRGFGSPQRTPLRDYHFRGRDWLLVGAVIVVGAAGAWLMLQ